MVRHASRVERAFDLMMALYRGPSPLGRPRPRRARRVAGRRQENREELPVSHLVENHGRSNREGVLPPACARTEERRPAPRCFDGGVLTAIGKSSQNTGGLPSVSPGEERRQPPKSMDTTFCGAEGGDSGGVAKVYGADLAVGVQ